MTRALSALALCAALFLAALGLVAPTAAQSDQLTVLVDRASIPAEGGSVAVTVRMSAEAAADDDEVTLTTDLGSFGADSGPSRVVVRPMVANGDGVAEASVRLVGDGQPGLAVITARVGSLVDAATVAFIGPPAEIVILRLGPDRPLDASRSHVVQLEVRDEFSRPVPGAPLRLEASAEDTAERQPTLRSSAGATGTLLALRTSDQGRATATLAAPPGDVQLLAVSVEAETDLALTFHGEPAQLLLSTINATLERGSETAFAIVLAQLIDEGGRAVPGRAVSFTPQPDSRVQITPEGLESEAERPRTDAGGQVLARAHATAAQSGVYWLRAQAGELANVVQLTVAGKPETIYLTVIPVDSLEGEESEGEIDEYLLHAEVVDSAGRRVAPGYTVRWRVVLSGGESALDQERSPVRGGVAAGRLRIENPEGPPTLQALLVERPEVNSEGRIADLAADGLPLRVGLNVVTWIGGETTIDQAIAPIAHIQTTVWRRQSEDKGWLVYTTRADAPQSEPYAIEDGVRLHIRVESAVRLPGVER